MRMISKTRVSPSAINPAMTIGRGGVDTRSLELAKDSGVPIEGTVSKAVKAGLSEKDAQKAREVEIEKIKKDTHDVNALAAELGKQVEAVNGGDLRRAEGLLIAQAHTLDNIFANLARRATGQQYLPQWEAYMRMAMKAQNQCRKT